MQQRSLHIQNFPKVPLWRFASVHFVPWFLKSFLAVLIVEIVVCPSLEKSRSLSLRYLYTGWIVFTSCDIEVIDPPSCLAFHPINVVYPDYIRWQPFQSSHGVITLIDSAKFGDGLFARRRLPSGIWRLTSPCREFLLPSIRTFNIFSSALCWFVNAVTVFPAEDCHLKESPSKIVMAVNSFVSPEWIFKTIFRSTLPHAFDVGLCYAMDLWCYKSWLDKINKSINKVLQI